MPKVFPRIDPQNIRAQASADGHVVLVTDALVRISAGDRVRLEVRIDRLRRIQFDIERQRPATLVIVPDDPANEPQVIKVLPEDFESVANALAVLAREMAGLKN